jgi:hypothetical protein
MITYAVKYGGQWHLLDAGPGTMIAFEDEFGQSLPDGPREGGHMWRHVAWIAHRILAPDLDFAAWADQLEDLTGDDDRLAEIREELGQTEKDPTPLQAASGAGG